MEIENALNELEAIESEMGNAKDCSCLGRGGTSMASSGSIAAELITLEQELDTLENGFDDVTLGNELDLEDELEFATALGDEEHESVPKGSS